MLENLLIGRCSRNEVLIQRKPVLGLKFDLGGVRIFEVDRAGVVKTSAVVKLDNMLFKFSCVHAGTVHLHDLM